MRKIIIAACFLLSIQVWSQAQNRVGFLPQVNLNISLGNGWKANTKLESRQIFADGEETGYRYERTDFAALLTRKNTAGSSWGAGYMIRFQGDDLIHRAIQQFSMVRKYEVLRIGHRFSTDQTFRPESPVEYRFRYRISSDFPLQGQSVDPGEFYLKLSNEYLGILEGGEADLEIRGLAALGWSQADYNKFEFGLDYRADALIHTSGRHNFWMYLGWFLSI